MSRHEISRWIDQQSVIDIQLSRWALFHWIVPTTAQHQLTTTTIETSCTWDGHTHLLPLGCIGSDVKTWNIKMNWPTISYWHTTFQVGAVPLNSTHNSTAPTDYYYYRNLMHLGWPHTFTSSRMHWSRCQDMKYQDELTNNQLLPYNFPGGRYSTE